MSGMGMATDRMYARAIGLFSELEFNNYEPAALQIAGSRSALSRILDAESREEKTSVDASVHARMTVAEYIESSFVPEYIAPKTSTGRMHFQSILKFVLTPGAVRRAFGIDAQTPKSVADPFPNWPYMDSTALRDVTPDLVAQVISEALDRGYSVQTATHIRNVIRTMFARAAEKHLFSGENPTVAVTLPRMVRKPARQLTLDQLQRILQIAQYP